MYQDAIFSYGEVGCRVEMAPWRRMCVYSLCTQTDLRTPRRLRSQEPNHITEDRLASQLVLREPCDEGHKSHWTIISYCSRWVLFLFKLWTIRVSADKRQHCEVECNNAASVMNYNLAKYMWRRKKEKAPMCRVISYIVCCWKVLTHNCKNSGVWGD